MKKALNDALNNHRSKYFPRAQVLLILVTLTSITSVILETVKALSSLDHIFSTIEMISTGIFTIEYLSRVFVSKKKTDYIFSGWGIIDLLTILPTFLGLGNFSFLKASRIFSILRLFRILRVAKIIRAYVQTHEGIEVESALNNLTITIYFIALFTAIIAFGSILYVFENDQMAYANIPVSMIQSTKIILGGLGQVEPKTLAGEISMLLGRLTGLALFGLLISVIGGTLNRLLFHHDLEK